MTNTILTLDVCSNCKHSKPLGRKTNPGEPTMECTRFPPVPFSFPITGAGGQQGFMQQNIFPMVFGEWTCGEYKRKLIAGISSPNPMGN